MSIFNLSSEFTHFLYVENVSLLIMMIDTSAEVIYISGNQVP